MAQTAANLGFDGVDLTVRPGGHVLPERVTIDLPKAVEAVRNVGLDVYMISTAIRSVNEPYTESILRTAGELEIPSYRTNWFSYDDSKSIINNLKLFTDRLQKLSALNAEYGIRGDYQNHMGDDFGAAIWDLWMVLDEIESEWLGSQYDIRHATVEGTESWTLGLKLIHPHIGTLDIKDFHWEYVNNEWQIRNVPLGEGQVDYKKYIELLQKQEIFVPVSLHYEYPLGGANHGAKSLTIPEDKVLNAFERDLNTLHAWLGRYGE